MLIRKGWSTEYARARFDVSVDEADLESLCIEHGIDPAYRARMTPVMKYLLLNELCEWLSVSESIRVLEGAEQQSAQQRAGEAQQRLVQYVTSIKAALGIAAPQQPAQG